MDARLRDSLLAQQEILNSVRLAHGDDVADGLTIAMHQCRLLTTTFAAHTALCNPCAPADLVSQLDETTRNVCADVVAGTTALALRDIDDPGAREALLEFTNTLLRRALNDAVEMVKGNRP